MRRLLASLLLAFLVACSSMGVPTPQTFNEKVAAAKVATTTAMDSVDILVVNHKMSAADATKAVDDIDTARQGINAAVAMYSTDPQGAQSKLALTITALQAVQTYLHAMGAPK